MKWVAPTDVFLEFGGEVGNGESFPGNDRNKNGVGNGNAYVHVGGDVGSSSSWRAGASYLQTAAKDRTWTQTDLAGNDAALAFTGRSRIAIADFVWKWAPNGNAQDTNFKLQGEYFWRRESGDLTYATTDAAGVTQTGNYRSDQRGFYAQGVWQFMPTWRVGARYDWLNPGSVDYGANGLYLADGSFNPQRAAVMLDWTPSEFSRFRVQFQQAKLETRPHRQRDFRPVHPDARRARRAQVLKGHAPWHPEFASCSACFSRQRPHRRLRCSTCLRPSPSGARSSTSWAATRSRSTSPPTRLQDPHHIEAKPSLIARARSADLVVATGAELEIGWLPLVLQQSGNPAIKPGKPGYFEAAPYVNLLDKPTRLDRAEGDVHPGGDPHIQTDPRNIAKVATPLAAAAGRARSARMRRGTSALQGLFRALERRDREMGEAGERH